MRFDPEKVLTPFNSEKGREGDIGWFANTPRELKALVGDFEKAKELVECDGMITMPFVSEDGNVSMFFYPASYEYLQEKWVKENDLKVGDRVKITRYWGEDEKGFSYFCPAVIENRIFIVKNIFSDHIRACEFPKFLMWSLPYFAIEKVVEEYRPFANAEEFAPYRDCWFSYGNTDELIRVTEYNDSGLKVGGQRMTYKHFFDTFSNETRGVPAGVKI